MTDQPPARGVALPRVDATVMMFSSIGSIVSAAAILAPRLVDQDFLAGIADPELRSGLRALADAVYQLDYHAERRE
jgi:hypothetical protein